jgi:hypothetical protein
MAELDFSQDVILGEAGECFMIDYLTSGNRGILLDRRKNYTWDFKIKFLKDNQVKTFEAKTDIYCIPDRILNGKKIMGKDSGNIFVEFYCRGKESGIRVTEADWFIYYFKYVGEIWLIKIDDLKELIRNNEFPIGVGGDYKSDSTGYLIPRYKFRKHFIYFNNIFQEELV